MQANVDWVDPDGVDADLLDARGVLYALTHPKSDRLLYIGKADRQSVRERVSCRSKQGVCDFLTGELGLARVNVVVGVVETAYRLTAELLSDIESLLIWELQPAANIQSIRARITRPGFIVECTGLWPAT